MCSKRYRRCCQHVFYHCCVHATLGCVNYRLAFDLQRNGATNFRVLQFGFAGIFIHHDTKLRSYVKFRFRFSAQQLKRNFIRT